MTNGSWNAVLQFLEEQNDRGRYCVCDCSQCNGTYVHKRAYINDDGDFVLSQDTLQSLLEDYKYSQNFDYGPDESKHGLWFSKYWKASKRDGFNEEERRVVSQLVKKEYDYDS